MLNHKEIINKSLCYNYVEDNGDVTDLKLHADHNTTATIKWYDSAEYKTLEESNLQSELNDSVDDNKYDWNVPTTIISVTEVALITNYKNTNNNVDFNQNSSSYSYLDTNTTTQPSSYLGTYWWLNDRTNNCVSQGCRISDETPYNYGYWTSTIIDNSSNVWRIHSGSEMSSRDTTFTQLGLRPVITISKSLLD